MKREVPKGWYELKIGDLIKSGDKYCIGNDEWQYYRLSKGKVVREYVTLSIRRIKPDKYFCCEICENKKDYKNEIEEGLNIISCSHGQFSIDHNIFFPWKITSSSEDKGYCSY